MATENRKLNIIISGAIDCQYKRTDNDLSPNNIQANVKYSDYQTVFASGNGYKRCNLIYFQRFNINNTTHYFDLDGILKNIWDDLLNYDSVKILMIHNRSSSGFLEVHFKNEIYHIGPEGTRIILEPFGAGITSITTSSSSEEGNLTIASDSNVDYDILIAGSETESSSSSSGQ